jgi:hypothetical protein
MIFYKKNNNAIIPTSSTDCFDKRCNNLYINRNISLQPYKVTEIEFDIVINIPEGYILKIVNHSNNNPWQIITSSIFTNNKPTDLKLLIISSEEHTLHINDIICHLQVQSLQEFHNYLKGNFYKFYFMYFFLFNSIYYRSF